MNEMICAKCGTDQLKEGCNWMCITTGDEQWKEYGFENRYAVLCSTCYKIGCKILAKAARDFLKTKISLENNV